MKILLIGEYSNVHWTLAQGLRQLGHNVTVISNGDFWKNYPRDIDVAREHGKLNGIRLLLKLWRLLPKMRGFDVVQLINPMFFELKAERLFFFYNYLRRHNKKMYRRKAVDGRTYGKPESGHSRSVSSQEPVAGSYP